jgi:hypothetical protein
MAEFGFSAVERPESDRLLDRDAGIMRSKNDVRR